MGHHHSHQQHDCTDSQHHRLHKWRQPGSRSADLQSGECRSDAADNSPPPPRALLELASRMADLSFVNHPAGVSGDCISRSIFYSSFMAENNVMGAALFGFFCRGCADNMSNSGSFCRRSDAVSVNAFIMGCQRVMMLLSDADQIEFYLRMFAATSDTCSSLQPADNNDLSDSGAESSGTISRDQLHALVLQAFETAMWAHQQAGKTATHSSPACVDTILTAVADSCMHARDAVSIVFARTWLLQNCPRLLKWMHRWLVHRITSGGERQRTTDAAIQTVPSSGSCVLDSASESSVASIHPALLFLLMSSLPELYTRPRCGHSLPSVLGLVHLDPDEFIARMVDSLTPRHWVSLYSSDDQGLSANRFQHLVTTYSGPTITLLRAAYDHLFCVAVDVGWRDSPHYWGGCQCMALQLLPKFQVLCQGEADLVYHNVSSRGMATGIRVGTNHKTPELTVNRDLNLLEHRGIPLYLSGVEVWGCGDSQTRDSQLCWQKREITRVEQRRQVNLMAETSWNDNPDKYLLELSGARQSYNY